MLKLKPRDLIAGAIDEKIIRLSKKSGDVVLELTQWDIICERLGLGGNRGESI